MGWDLYTAPAEFNCPTTVTTDHDVLIFTKQTKFHEKNQPSAMKGNLKGLTMAKLLKRPVTAPPGDCTSSRVVVAAHLYLSCCHGNGDDKSSHANLCHCFFLQCLFQSSNLDLVLLFLEPPASTTAKTSTTNVFHLHPFKIPLKHTIEAQRTKPSDSKCC